MNKVLLIANDKFVINTHFSNLADEQVLDFVSLNDFSENYNFKDRKSLSFGDIILIIKLLKFVKNGKYKKLAFFGYKAILYSIFFPFNSKILFICGEYRSSIKSKFLINCYVKYLRLYELILTDSIWQFNFLKSEFPRTNVKLISNYGSIKGVKVNSNIIPDKYIDFIYVGRISIQKGFKAIEYLINNIEKRNSYNYLFIGPVELNEKDSQEFELMKKVYRIKHLISLSENEVYEKFELSKCLLNPSLSEGFGSTIIEAISRQCKVVITPYNSSFELRNTFKSLKVSSTFSKEDFYTEVINSINTEFDHDDLKNITQKYNSLDHILFYKKIFLDDNL